MTTIGLSKSCLKRFVKAIAILIYKKKKIEKQIDNSSEQ